MRKLVGFLVVLVVLLVGADFGLRYLATRQIGDALQSRLNLATRPDVSVDGFPFVLQAVEGSYGTIHAALPPATVGPLDDVGITVALDGVRLPLGDAIAGNVDRLTADGGQARLTVPTSSVAAAAGLPDLRITEENGSLVVTVTISVLGRQFPVTAQLDATVTDAGLSLRNGAISGVGVTLPSEVLSTVTALVDLTVPLDGLPVVITGGRVSVAGTDLVIDATTSALDLTAP